MKALHCGELMKGCDFVARGATEDEVMTNMPRQPWHRQYYAGVGAEGQSGDQERIADASASVGRKGLSENLCATVLSTSRSDRGGVAVRCRQRGLWQRRARAPRRAT